MSKPSQHGALLAHPGTQHARRLAAQLEKRGLLQGFYTGFALSAEGVVARLCGNIPPVRKRISNRIVAGVPPRHLHTFPVVEGNALRALKRGAPNQQVFLRRNREFQEKIPTRALREATALIGFDTSSWILAERARELGRPFFMEQTIAHARSRDRVFADLRARYPQWAEALEERLPEVQACEDREHALASRILAGSSFVKRSLLENSVEAGKVDVLPYGVDLAQFAGIGDRHPGETRPPRFLFLGSLSARKGVPLLLEVWPKLRREDWELWLVGPAAEKVRPLLPDIPGVHYKGAVAHRDLPTVLEACDVMVLPSFFEGLSLVQLEALASAMPLVGTTHSGAEDLISEGREGFVIDAGDAEALQGRLQYFIDHPGELPVFRQNARERAQALSWEAYGERWSKLLHEYAAAV